MSESNAPEKPTAPPRDQPGNNVALLIIDMINPFDFEDAERVLPKARRAADVILKLREQADANGMPVIYVNDNFGEWHSEKSRLVDRMSDRIAAELAPREDDYFIIKPQFSGFYATNLPVLLPKLGVRHLVLTGVATDICVLFTAADAHMRDYALWVPEDAVAAESDRRAEAALAIIRAHMGGETTSTGELDLADWHRRVASGFGSERRRDAAKG
jgi:nicotinamidase-related amidase